MSATISSFYNQENKCQKGGESEYRSYLFQKWTGSGKLVLDVGCGDGFEAEQLRKNGNTVYGLEISRTAAIEAEKRGIKVFVVNVAEADLPVADDFFDVIIAGEIIEHVMDTDEFLRKLRRKLKPGGRLLLSTPNLGSFGRRLMLLVGKNPFVEFSLEEKVSGAQPVGHLRYFVKQDLIGLLRKHGFRVDVFTSDSFNFWAFQSRFLGRLLPSLSVRFIVNAVKE